MQNAKTRPALEALSAYKPSYNLAVTKKGIQSDWRRPSAIEDLYAGAEGYTKKELLRLNFY